MCFVALYFFVHRYTNGKQSPERNKTEIGLIHVEFRRLSILCRRMSFTSLSFISKNPILFTYLKDVVTEINQWFLRFLPFALCTQSKLQMRYNLCKYNFSHWKVKIREINPALFGINHLKIFVNIVFLFRIALFDRFIRFDSWSLLFFFFLPTQVIKALMSTWETFWLPTAS